MRKLIYQQQAVERVQNKLSEVFQCPKTEYAEGYVNACNAFLRMLDDVPAVDAVPVKRGRWIVHYGNWADVYECDQCHHESKEGGKYCSNCGARMEETDGQKHERL